MNKMHAITSLVLSSLILGGCDTVKDTFGLNHKAPNEWNTAEPNPPLIIPPGLFDRPKLPPPCPGAPNPNAVSPEKRAQKTVLGDASGVPDSAPTEGEKNVVGRASENQSVTPNIRKIVDDEDQEESTVSGKITAKIKSWKKEATENLTLSPSQLEGDEKEQD